MTVYRRRQLQQGLKDTLDRCHRDQVLAPDHMGDALRRVVDDRGDDIARADVLAPHDHIAQRLGSGVMNAGIDAFFGPGQPRQVAEPSPGPVQRQPPGKGLSRLQPPDFLVRVVRAPGEGRRVRRVIGMGRHPRQRQPLLAGAKAAIQQPLFAQGLQRPVVRIPVIRLAPHGRLPVQTQPGQILEHGFGIFGPTTGEVRVLDPQQEPPPGLARRRPGRQGRKGMALVQKAGGRGGKPGDQRHAGRARGFRPRWPDSGVIAGQSSARLGMGRP